MGLAIFEFFKSGRDKPIHNWIDNEEEESMLPSLFFRNELLLPELEKAAIDHARGRVLDVGAGAGRHSIILQERGFEVVALDASSHSCEVMKDRGLKKVICSDIFSFNGEKFDTILLLMNGFGIAGNEQGLPFFIQHLKSLLNPGGAIIGESTDILYTLENQAGLHPINLSKRYYGEVVFRLEYSDHRSEFPWIYADENLLETISKQCGLKFSLLGRGDRFNYLCKLEN